jgi:hypothetical protein
MLFWENSRKSECSALILPVLLRVTAFSSKTEFLEPAVQAEYFFDFFDSLLGQNPLKEDVRWSWRSYGIAGLIAFG